MYSVKTTDITQQYIIVRGTLIIRHPEDIYPVLINEWSLDVFFFSRKSVLCSNYVTSFYMNIMNTYENDILIIDDLGLPIEIQKLLITLDKLDYTNYLVHCHDQDDKCSLDIFFYKNI